MSKSRKRARTLGIVGAVVLVLLVAAFIAKDRLFVGDTAGAADSTATAETENAGDDDDETPPPVPVEIARAERREISSYYVTTATLEPERKVDILAKVAGEVVKIVAEEGQIVKAGDLLARLDDREQKVALEAERINRDQKKRELDRIEDMHKRDLFSDKEYADIQYQFALAKNLYESALLQYRYTQIRAPFDGVVTERIVDEGEHVGVASKLFVVADTDPLQLTMYLPESEIRSIHPGQAVYITPDINPDMQIDGEIIRLAPEVDQRTGTVKVTAVVRGGGFPGSFVRVRIITDTHSETIAVPRRSIINDAGESYVFIAEADTVRRAEVETGYEDEHFTEIVRGLSAGDTVVTAGVGAIREGTKVKILDPERDEVTEAAHN